MTIPGIYPSEHFAASKSADQCFRNTKNFDGFWGTEVAKGLFGQGDTKVFTKSTLVKTGVLTFYHGSRPRVKKAVCLCGFTIESKKVNLALIYGLEYNICKTMREVSYFKTFYFSLLIDSNLNEKSDHLALGFELLKLGCLFCLLFFFPPLLLISDSCRGPVILYIRSSSNDSSSSSLAGERSSPHWQSKREFVEVLMTFQANRWLVPKYFSFGGNYVVLKMKPALFFPWRHYPTDTFLTEELQKSVARGSWTKQDKLIIWLRL